MDEPASYEIRLAEHLEERWAKWFDGLDIIHPESGETIIRGEMADQPALFGVLGKVRDLGVTLISVQRLSPFKAGRGVGRTSPDQTATDSVSEVSLGALASKAASNSNGISDEGR
jgi:hypothetical protein